MTALDRRLVATWSAGVLTAGLATLALALLLGGGAPPPAPPGLPANGRLPAWIGTVATLLALLTGVVTVGLGMAGSGAYDRHRPAARAAEAVTASLWAAITAGQIGLVAWELSGRADLTDSSRFRALAVQFAFVVVAAVAASFVRRPVAGWVSVTAALAALLPVVVTGHARSADRPALVVVATSAHVLAAAVWVGGLAALGWLAAERASHWIDGVPRHSRLALISVIVLAGSGVVAATGHLARPGQLFTTRYGAVVTLKIVLLGGLITAGWLQRGRFLVRAGPDRRSFLALAGLELVLMTLASALAVALARTPPPA